MSFDCLLLLYLRKNGFTSASVALHGCMCARLCPTLCHQAPPSMGFSRQEHCSGLPSPILGHLPDPGIEPMSLSSPASTGGFFASGTTWETIVIFSSGQSLSRVRLFAAPRIAARQASLSITNSRSLSKLMSNESVMSSSHLILCRPLLLPPPIPSSILGLYN